MLCCVVSAIAVELRGNVKQDQKLGLSIGRIQLEKDVDLETAETAQSVGRQNHHGHGHGGKFQF